MNGNLFFSDLRQEWSLMYFLLPLQNESFMAKVLLVSQVLHGCRVSHFLLDSFRIIL